MLWKLRQQRGLQADFVYLTNALVDTSKTRCKLFYPADCELRKYFPSLFTHVFLGLLNSSPLSAATGQQPNCSSFHF
jgi:hypothetical protein